MTQKYISGSTLKIIAMISMLIDHIAAGILLRVLVAGGAGGMAGTVLADVIPAPLRDYSTLYKTYDIMRGIGRIAFPIYCFLLVEGFLHTSDRRKYAMRLAIFALISEVPFDLALMGGSLEYTHQNVFFSLLLGLLAMWGIEYGFSHGKTDWGGVTFALVSAGACMGAAQLFHTDYDAIGILCMLILYLYRNNRLLQSAAGALSFVWWEQPAVLAFIPVYFYNGKRGIRLKYLFYAFYPVHLILIYLACRALGIAHYPV